ncbi:MAG: DUF4827 family protein [Muribaculaceae bacterium]
MNVNIKLLLLSLVAVVFCTTSCSNNKSYAEQLADERVAVNYYLAGKKVINEVPSDTVFQTGTDAPFYRIDPDGNVYMQVITNTGLDQRPSDDEVVYFRYMRFNLITWCENGGDVTEVGNMNDMGNSYTYFLYNNYTVDTSSQYGQGLQLPLSFVGLGSEVNLIIKSQMGINDEIADVNPYHWHVRYFKSKM